MVTSVPTHDSPPITVSLRGAGLQLAADCWDPDRANGVILLLHGGGQSRHSWTRTAQRLALRGWKVIVPDLRGHGDSDWASTPAGYAFDRFGDDVREIVTAMPDKPIVVGASLGGMAALMAQGSASSQLFAGLVLVDVVPRLNLDGGLRIAKFMTAFPDGFDSLDAVQDALAKFQPRRREAASALTERVVARDRAGRYRWRWDPNFLAAWHELLAADDTSALEREADKLARRLVTAARSVEAPLLLVRGGRSDVVRTEDADAFLSAVPGAQFVEVTQAGHTVAADNNDRFTNCVSEFAAGLAGHVNR